ncbi:hypothetical protein PS3A_13850 [Pseudomonas sp. 3A(2025)]
MAMAFSGHLSALDLSSPLEDFNHMPPSEPSIVSTDADLTRRFTGKQFMCTKVEDHTPQESETAARAFDEFRVYSLIGERDESFWSDSAHRQRRDALRDAAVKAGGWRADYVDVLWQLRGERKPDVVNELSVRLQTLATTVPMAMYRYGRFLWPYQNSDMYYLEDAAIDRGSPQAMTYVSNTILVRAKALFPLARSMLECAASQGHAQAYEGLGTLAHREGRRLDAYRLWVKGINEGCEDCIENLQQLKQARANTPEKRERKRQLLEKLKSADPSSAEKYGEELASLRFQDIQMQIPELERLKKFYADNFLYEVTELPEFRLRPSGDVLFYPDDSELLLLLQIEAGLVDLP